MALPGGQLNPVISAVWRASRRDVADAVLIAQFHLDLRVDCRDGLPLCDFVRGSACLPGHSLQIIFAMLLHSLQDRGPEGWPSLDGIGKANRVEDDVGLLRGPDRRVDRYGILPGHAVREQNDGLSARLPGHHARGRFLDRTVEERSDFAGNGQPFQSGCELTARGGHTLQHIDPGVEVDDKCLVFPLAHNLIEKGPAAALSRSRTSLWLRLVSTKSPTVRGRSDSREK